LALLVYSGLLAAAIFFYFHSSACSVPWNACTERSGFFSDLVCQ